MEVQKSTEGVTILGTPVGNQSYIHDVVSKKVKSIIAAINLLPELNDPQIELCLIRACFGNSQIAHLTRTLGPESLFDALYDLDAKVQQFPEAYLGYFFKNRTNSGLGTNRDILRDIWSLPISFGGFALPELLPRSILNFAASIVATKDLQILISGSFRAPPDLHVIGMSRDQLIELGAGCNGFQLQKKLNLIYNKKLYDDIFPNLDERGKATILARCQKYSQEWLIAAPSVYRKTSLKPEIFTALLKYNSGLPFIDSPKFCPECNKEQDVFGDHAISCSHTNGRITKHNRIRDIIDKGCKDGSYMTRTEMSLGRNEVRDSQDRAGDLVILQYDNGCDLNADITVVNPRLKTYLPHAQSPLGACLKRIEEKRYKYRDIIGNQWFEPLVVETFGGWSSNSHPIFKRIAQRIAPRKNQTYGQALKYLATNLSFALQTANGEMLARRVLII